MYLLSGINTYLFFSEFVYKTRKDPNNSVETDDLLHSLYRNIPSTHHVLKKVPNWEYCGAIRFPGEGDSFCCRKGKVIVYIHGIHDALHRLFTSQTDSDALYFRKNIQYFNSHFSFTSFGASVDRRLATAAGT